MSIRRVSSYLVLVFLAVTLIWALAGSKLSSQAVPPQETVISGRNVNMVSGDVLPGGDPWLQRQNEPSIAVSSRNPLHLLAGANDYRTVDMPTSEGELPGKQPTAAVGDAWLGVFMSYDGGESWTSTMLPGFPQDPLLGNPLKAYRAAADPVVRSGPNGLFYFSGIAFNRTDNVGVVFVARFIDDNNKEGGGSIRYIDTKIIAKGTVTKFLDKPWISVDQPRLPASNITISGQTFPRHNVYLAYSAFTGTTNTVGDIMFSRSADCGTTWGAPIKISSGSYAHQGATIAIKPVVGEVLVAWRRFGVSGRTPDSIFVAQSLSRGLNFQSPVKVADVAPFDQPTTDETQALPGAGAGFAFRTNSYPTMTVDKSGHVYLAWAQRGVGTGGGARVVLSSSYFGSNWSVPQAVANLDENALPFLGHQLMPSLSFAAGKLILVWYDQRHDVSGGLTGFNNWIIDVVGGYRHTMDVWAAEADTSTFPTLNWKSSQVSRYLHAMLQDGNGDLVYTSDGDPIVFPVQFNCVNYPLFKGGHNPFNGDYIDVAAAPTFKQDTWRNWIFNTDGPEKPIFHVAWTDNRDVRPPSNNNWTLYTPPVSTQGEAYISDERPGCNPYASGNEPGMRNQNIYTSRVTWGIEAGSPVNDKPLNLPGSTARAFVVFVKNNTELLKSYRLVIAGQPVGGQASFEQFSLLTTLDVEIAAFSTISRPLFIKSTDINAAVTININEINASGAVIANGLSSSILINGDTSNPQMSGNEETHNPNIVNSANPNIVNWYVNPNIVNPHIRNQNIVNPNIVNPNIVNPNIRNPNIVNPNIVNPNIVNPNIVNPNIVNREVANPNIVNPNIVNPNIVNPNIRNATPEDVTATDVEWTVKNEGTTTTSYTLKTLAKMAPPEGVYVQLLVYRVHYTPAVAGAELKAAGVDACVLRQEPHHELVLSVVNPNIVNPNIVNPNIVNPNIRNASIENATFSVAPGEEVVVDLRVLDSGVSTTSGFKAANAMAPGTAAPQAFSVEEFIDSLGFAVTSQAVNSTDAAAGSQIPPADATDLVIGTSSLPDGVADYSYSATLSAFGGSGSYSWSLNAGELPTGLSLGGTGLIGGVPTVAGTYQFIVRVDAGGQFDTQQYSIVIDSDTVPDTLSVVTTALPNGVQGHWYGATLESVGGVYPRSWSLASGPLPDGLSLDSGGVISGTPTTEGTSIFSVRVADRNGTIAVRSLSIDIAAETSTYFSITGTIYNETNGLPLAGVVLRGLPNTPVTGTNGTYTDQVPAGWTGTAIPFMAGHTFSPPNRTYSSVSSIQSGEDYNYQYASLTVSGTVLLGGTGLSGVVMNGLPGNPSTNVAGYYTATVSYGWTGTVTPTLTGYIFTPEYHSYSPVTSAQVTNYTAVLIFGPASKLVFTQSPNGGVGGAVWTKQPKVEVQDASGNRVTADDTTVVTLVIGNNPSDGSPSGQSSMTVTDGEAIFSGLFINKGEFGYTLRAISNPPFAEATSEPFGIEGFSPTGNSMYPERVGHTATPIVIGTGEDAKDAVLIAGGVENDAWVSTIVDIYDPANNTFDTLEGTMNNARTGHTATSLLDGTVLFVGGEPNPTSAEIFDPQTGGFTPIADMVHPHVGHRATLLQDGRVLITGNIQMDQDAAEIFDPQSGTFTETGSMTSARSKHTSTLLLNGKVLITGGRRNVYDGTGLETAELYDPDAGEFTAIDDMTDGPRWNHQATLLDDGTVLITGGDNGEGSSISANIYNPAPSEGHSYGSFEIRQMYNTHVGHQAVLLRDGTVLLIGGNNTNNANEIYFPSTWFFRPTGPMSISRMDGAAAVLPDGRVLITGGYSTGVATNTAEVWNPLVPFPTHVISGTIMPSGPGIGGIMLVGLPGHPMTNSGGYYEGLVLNGWTGTVTPAKTGYSFSPVVRTYSNVISDAPVQNYAVTSAPSVTAKLAFSQQPIRTMKDIAIFPTVKVEVQNVMGERITGATDTISLSIETNPVGGALTGTLVKSAVDGIATFDDLKIDTIGSGYVLKATSNGLTEALSASFEIYTPTIEVSFVESSYRHLEIGHLYLAFHIHNPAGLAGGISRSAVNGTAINGTDFNFGGGAETWRAGYPRTWDIGFDVGFLDDSIREGDETFSVTLTLIQNPENFTFIGTNSMTITIEDNDPDPAAGLAVATKVIPDGDKNLPYGKTLQAVGGIPPYTWSLTVGIIPSGLSLNPGTGELSGTLTESGRFDFAIRVTDSASNSATQAYSLVSSDWLVRESGSSNSGEGAKAVAVDAAGFVYVAGTIYGGDPTLGGSGYDWFTAKYNSTGSEIWHRTWNSTANDNDTAVAIAVDSSGNVYVAGESFWATTKRDFAVIKYSSSGDPVWTGDDNGAVRYNGSGNNDEYVKALAVDSLGNVIVSGMSLGDGTGWDYATIKYQPTGSLAWTGGGFHNGAVRYSSPGNVYDSLNDMTLDADGNIYVTGWIAVGSDNYDYATIKYSSAGTVAWLRTYDGPVSGHDYANAIVVDHAGNVIVTGMSQGKSPTSLGYFPSLFIFDFATIKYTPNGSLAWSGPQFHRGAIRYNSSKDYSDSPVDVAIDADDDIYVTGWSYQGPYSGKDIATIKYARDGNALWGGGPGFDNGAAIYNARFGDDVPQALAVDGFGNIYVIGNGSVNLSGSPGDYTDWITLKYHNNGELNWDAWHNGADNSSDNPQRIATDPAGNVYVVGSEGHASFYDTDFAAIKYVAEFLPGSAQNVDLIGPRTALKDVISAPLTLYAKDGSGHSTMVSTDTVFNLSSGGTATFYSDREGSQVITQATIKSGTDSITFFHMNAVVGTYDITATRSSGDEIGADSHGISIVLPLEISTTSLPEGMVGQLYGATLQATGGTPPYTWSKVSGSVWINISTGGEITGTPNSQGDFSVTVRDSSSPQLSNTKELTIVVDQPYDLVPVSNPSFEEVGSGGFAHDWSPIGSATFASDDTVSRTGQKSVSIVCPSGDCQGGNNNIESTNNIAIGQYQYLITAWFMYDGPGTPDDDDFARLGFSYRTFGGSSAGTRLNSVSKGVWKRMNIFITTPHSYGELIKVRLGIDHNIPNINVWFDDVEIRKYR